MQGTKKLLVAFLVSAILIPLLNQCGKKDKPVRVNEVVNRYPVKLN